MGGKKQLQLTLLENGLDFIREGVEALYGKHSEPPARAHKYALLHLFSGTLLVLKERLRREHESLIFVKVAECRKPDARTVDFDEVIGRLVGSANVKLDDGDAKLLRKVQGKRNALEHYEANLDIDEVNNLVGALVEFLERFMHEELQESIFKHISGKAGREIADLAKIAERIREREHAAWLKRASPYTNLTDEQLDQLAERYSDGASGDDPGQSMLDCPECRDESVGSIEQDIGVCTNHECREIHMLERCERCSSFVVLGGGAWCDECSNYMGDVMDRDN